MADSRHIFDVIFEDQSLGLKFLPYNDNKWAVVDGFYKLNDNVLQAEKSTKVALFDRVVAIQGKTVEGYDFNKILSLLHTKKRPIRITFERTTNRNSADISWNEVLSNTNEMYIYTAFLQRKGAFLCSVWMGFLREMEKLPFFRNEDRSQMVQRLIHDYILEEGNYTKYMFYLSPLPLSKLVDAKNMEYCLHNLKVQLRDRIRELTWNAFTASPEYQFLRLNLKTVLYDHHSCNVFLAFVIYRSTYRELALWMDIHYRLMPLLKQTHYPESVEEAYKFYMINPCLPNINEEELPEHLNNVEENLEKCALFSQIEAILKTKAQSYLSSTDPVALVNSISAGSTLSLSMKGAEMNSTMKGAEMNSTMKGAEMNSAMKGAEMNSTMKDVEINSTMSENAEDESPLLKRQSESSVISVEEQEMNTYCVYSDEEMKNLSSMLQCLSRQYFESCTLKVLPPLYYDVMKEVIHMLSIGIYLDSVTLDLLTHMLVCAQIRLFHHILNFNYYSFVETDFFEYLVSEIRCPRDSTMSFSRLRKATQYTMDRLKNCEEEIPHLRKFIQGGWSAGK